MAGLAGDGPAEGPMEDEDAHELAELEPVAGMKSSCLVLRRKARRQKFPSKHIQVRGFLTVLHLGILVRTIYQPVFQKPLRDIH